MKMLQDADKSEFEKLSTCLKSQIRTVGILLMQTYLTLGT